MKFISKSQVIKIKTTLLLSILSLMFFLCNNEEDELRIKAEQFLIGEWQIDAIAVTTSLPVGSTMDCYSGPNGSSQPNGQLSLTDGKFGSFSNASTCMGNSRLNSEVWTFE